MLIKFPRSHIQKSLYTQQCYLHNIANYGLHIIVNFFAAKLIESPIAASKKATARSKTPGINMLKIALAYTRQRISIIEYTRSLTCHRFVYGRRDHRDRAHSSVIGRVSRAYFSINNCVSTTECTSKHMAYQPNKHRVGVIIASCIVFAMRLRSFSRSTSKRENNAP